MDSADFVPVAALMALTALGIAAIWYLATTHRTTRLAELESRYRALAESSAATQSAVHGQLERALQQLAEINGRMQAVERILKDAE